MRKKVHMSAPLFSPALDSIIPELAICQYFTRNKYVSLAFVTYNSFFQMMWLTNFQLANSQTCNSQIRKLATRSLVDSQLAHYPDSQKTLLAPRGIMN